MKYSFCVAVAGLIAAMSLSGCGEGYQRIDYKGIPYNNTRTAGTGVAYVRANIMPEKGPVLDAATKKPDAFPQEAEVLFKKMQKK